MAATKGKLTKIQQEQVRSRIQSTQLIKRLQYFALGQVDPANTGDKPVELDPNRIRAIEILLRKSVPDLQSVELSSIGNGIVIQIASDVSKL